MPPLILGQQKSVIKYAYIDSLLRDSFYFSLLKTSGDPFKITKELKPLATTFSKKGKAFITSCEYHIPDISVSLIADGYGHLSFMIPNDTILISFKKLQKTDGQYKLNGYPSTYFNAFEYQGKLSHIYSLFDSIAYYTGPLFMGGHVSIKNTNFDLRTFFDTVTKVYDKRLHYLNMYRLKYNIPSPFVKLATAEIKAAYTDNLLDPLSNILKHFDLKDYPKSYIDSLNSFGDIDPNLFFHTIVYYNTAYRYLNAYKSYDRLVPYSDNNQHLKRTYDFIDDKIKDIKVREMLLAFHLSYGVKLNLSSSDTLFNAFKAKYPKSNYIKLIDSIYLKRNSNAKITLNDALRAVIVGKKRDKLTIKDILKAKPVIIDCWASWCMPCIKQMPFSMKLEKLYKDKVDFVYLSFDKSADLWIAKSNELDLGKSFLLDNNFKSLFACHFNINSIPRYLIFDRSGKLVNDNAPRPSKNDALIKILNDLIKNE